MSNERYTCPLCGAMPYDQFREPVVTDKMVERFCDALGPFWPEGEIPADLVRMALEATLR